MACFHSSIPVDQLTNMAKFEQISQSHKLSKKTSISACEQSRSALIDLVILIAVIGACGFLIYPYVSLLLSATLEFLEEIMCAVTEEALDAPMIYGCVVLSILSASTAVLALTLCTSPKCGKPGCLGLHKAAEFDIQLETQDTVKNSNSNSHSSRNLDKYVLKKGLFELPRDYQRELEAELKKIAPANGRAVLVFRARCGCSIGRMEVPGPRKNNRKMKQ